MLGSARIGEREVLALGAEIGWQTLEEFVPAWFDYSEQRMAAAIRKIPAGKMKIIVTHDPFPKLPEEGLPINVTVEVDPSQATIDIDLRDNPDNINCGLNLTEATSQSGAMTGVFNSIDHTVPPNAGSFRRVRIHLREGCIVGIPRHPYSCSMGTSNLCDRIGNAVAHAIAELGEGFGMAESGGLLPPATGVISGTDPRSGENYVNEIFLAHTAAGASPTADGWLTLTSIGSAGLCLLDSVELDELRFPIRVYKQEIAQDSEGAGRRRGAPGAHVEYGPIDSEMTVAYASDCSTHPAKGARGGGPAACARQIKRDINGNEFELEACAEVLLGPGEVMISITQPGAGYGAAFEREPARVCKDIAEGWISRDRAETSYGVILDDAGNVDAEKTQRLRSG